MNSADVAVTHQIKIGRESAWVKVGVTLDVERHSDIESTIETANRLVQRKVMAVIEDTVATVNKYEEKK
jgi:hypothetical protein